MGAAASGQVLGLRGEGEGRSSVQPNSEYRQITQAWDGLEVNFMLVVMEKGLLSKISLQTRSWGTRCLSEREHTLRDFTNDHVTGV